MLTKKALGHIRHDVKGYGLFKGALILWLKTRPKGTAPASVRSRVLGSTVLVRPGTSDMAMFDQFELHPYIPLEPTVAPLTILDLGANIGLSVRYWKHRAPNARVIAVEPDASNFAMLEANTHGLADVHLLQAGVRGSPGRLSIHRMGVGNAAFRTVPTTDIGEVEAVTIPQLIDRFGLSHIDLVKVDIEGSELDVFGALDTSWLGSVRTVAVELHDRTTPGCGDAFFTALQGRSWSYAVHGEMIMCTRRGN